MRNRSITIALGLGMLVGACVLAGVAGATQPSGTNGEIAYQRYRLTDNPLWAELFVTSASGTGVRRLTLAPRGYVDAAPDWSPDGSKVVFQRCAPESAGGLCAVWIVDRDGSGARRLTPPCPAGARSGCADDSQPSFAPDGLHLVAVRSSGAERRDAAGNKQIETSAVVRMNLDGGGVRVLVAGSPFSGDILGPQLSPDGKRLAYISWTSVFARPKNRRAIYVANVDGRNAHRVTSWRTQLAERLDWAPDGSRILFQGGAGATVGRGQGNLFTIRPDGRDERQLTHFAQTGGALRMGSYSPDGRSIVFATTAGATAPERGLPDLFVMAADGTSIRPVTRAPNWDGSPDWGA